MSDATPFVYVRWFDSAIVHDRCQPDDIGGYCENESAGLLVRHTDKEIVIALDRCLDNGDLRLVLYIPKENVRSVHYFTAPNAPPPA